MDTALKIARLTVLLSVAFACSMLGIACMQARMETIAVAAKAEAAIDAVEGPAAGMPARIDASLDNLDTQVSSIAPVVKNAGTVLDNLAAVETKTGDAIELTSHRINDLCPDAKAADAAIHPCGTLADTNRTLATVRGTSGQVEQALLKFNQHENDLFTQENTAYAEMNKSVTDFDALVSDSDLKASIHNGATITGNVAGITTDGRVWFHAKLFPTKKQGFVTGFDATGDALKHWMPPLF